MPQLLNATTIVGGLTTDSLASSGDAVVSGRLGVGIAPAYALDIYTTSPGNAGGVGINAFADADITANASGIYYGFTATVQSPLNPYTISSMRGFYALTDFRGTKAAASGTQITSLFGASTLAYTDPASTGDVNTMTGMQTKVEHAGDGSVAQMYGLNLTAQIDSGGGPVALMQAMFVQNLNSSTSTIGTSYTLRVHVPGGTGPITTHYGVYIANQGRANITANYGVYVDNQSGGGGNYALYTNNGPVRFGDSVTLVGGSVATDNSTNLLKLTGTMPTTPTAFVQGVLFDITSAGSAAQINHGLRVNYNAGYTGAQATAALSVANSAAGTAGSIIKSGTPDGNVGMIFVALGTTTGYNYGVAGFARQGDVSIGGVFRAGFNTTVSPNYKAGATYIGAMGVASNVATSGGKQIGGYFSLDQVDPTFASAALIADNGTQTDPIFIARDNGVGVFQVLDGGLISYLANDAATSALSLIGVYDHNTSGTPAAGFGSYELYRLQSSTTQYQAAADITVKWSDATQATRKGRILLNAYDSVGVPRTGVEVGASGTAVLLGLWGSAPIALGANGTVLGVSAGAIAFITPLTNPMTTAGDIILGGSAGVATRLAKGADSTVLTIDPATHLPLWQAIPASGAPTSASYVTTSAEAGLSAETVLGTGVLMTGAYSALPAAATGGRIYLPTDSPYLLRDSGAAWAGWGPLYALTKPPAFASWAWVNQGNAVASDSGAGILLTATGFATSSMMLLAKAAPATPYTVTFGILSNMTANGGNAMLSVGFRDSVSGKCVLLEHYQSGNLIVENWTAANTYSGVNFTARAMNMRQLYWLRIADNGTTRTYSISADGVNFDTIGSDGHANFATPNQIVWGINNPNTALTVPMSLTLISYKEA